MKVMVIVKASKSSEAGEMPSTELLTAMGKYNEDLAKAGLLLDGAGLTPSSKGARVRFSGTQRSVPECELKVADAPCFERYTSEFNPRSGLGGMEIWIPLEAN